MEKGYKSSKTEISIQEILVKENFMVKEHTNGKMETFMQDNLFKVKDKVQENGQHNKETFFRANLSTTLNTDGGKYYGQTDRATKDTFKMI